MTSASCTDRPIGATRRICRARRRAVLGAAAAAIASASGCTYPGNTSGFKAEQKLTRAQIDQRITEVQNNPRIPQGIKAMALKKLQKDRQTAQ
ncbi:MAG TPA: hypothetical protein VGS41_13935 [Chthonomonadales bacterium]|nr:hypothetical protein [Chthonomonadales bacterium]